MAALSESEIIKSKPIGEGLAAFRDALQSTCADLGVPASADECIRSSTEVRHVNCCRVQYMLITYTVGAENLVLDLILALQNLPAARLFPSPNGRGILLSDLLRLTSLVISDDFDVKFVTRLLRDVVNNEADTQIWNIVKNLVTLSRLASLITHKDGCLAVPPFLLYAQSTHKYYSPKHLHTDMN